MERSDILNLLDDDKLFEVSEYLRKAWYVIDSCTSVDDRVHDDGYCAFNDFCIRVCLEVYNREIVK